MQRESRVKSDRVQSAARLETDPVGKATEKIPREVSQRSHKIGPKDFRS